MIRYVSEHKADSMEEDVERFIIRRRLSDGHLLHFMDTFHVALVVCSDNHVYDHEIYSRQLWESKFDEHHSSLSLFHDNVTDNRVLTSIKRIPKDTNDIVDELMDIPEDVIRENLYSGVDEYGIEVYVILIQDHLLRVVKEIHIPMYFYDHVLLSPSVKAKIEMDAHLASCVFYEMKRSRRFRKRFLNYVRGKKCFYRCLSSEVSGENGLISASLDIPCLVEIRLKWPKQKIDYAWDYRICGELQKRVNLEENMAWLNTLGGGYGALGDYFQYHATKAGETAIHQLMISLELGDEISAAKCRLFFAQSLLQCGYLRQCKRLIKEQYQFACSLTFWDEKLVAMCISLWNRLRYKISLKKLEEKKDPTK